MQAVASRQISCSVLCQIWVERWPSQQVNICVACMCLKLQLITNTMPSSIFACMTAVQCCAETPGVSQIVYPFGPDGDPDDGVQYMRVLDRR